LRAAGRESISMTPAIWGTAACCLTKSKFTILLYHPALACAAGASAASTGMLTRLALAMQTEVSRAAKRGVGLKVMFYSLK
jgi:hypothetical protein